MSLIKTIVEGSEFDASAAIAKALNRRAVFVIEELKKSQDLVKGSRIMEMRDAPDQSSYPITRRGVEKMLSTYERRAESDSTENPEPRDIEGAKRARWYAPEHNSDFIDDIDPEQKDARNPDDRPAKLMPYDYYFTVTKPKDVNTETASQISDVDTQNDEEDWEGEENQYFKESEENGADSVSQLLHDSTKHSYPVEFHLDDGSYVTVHPQQAQHIINSGRDRDIMNHTISASHFQTFLDDVYDKKEGVQYGK